MTIDKAEFDGKIQAIEKLIAFIRNYSSPLNTGQLKTDAVNSLYVEAKVMLDWLLFERAGSIQELNKLKPKHKEEDVPLERRPFCDFLRYKIGIIDGIMPRFEYAGNRIKWQSVVDLREKTFSALEWATIFYYADSNRSVSNDNILGRRIENFKVKHSIFTTSGNLTTKYYQAKRRINEKMDYPIKKLESIMPFLTDNYPQVVTLLKNDIEIIKNNSSDF